MLCEKNRENTNKYAGFVKSATFDKWEPIGDKKFLWKPFEDIEELFSFIAIILIMGIGKLPRIKDFWPSNPMLGNDKVKRTFARDSHSRLIKFKLTTSRNYSSELAELCLNDDDIYQALEEIHLMEVNVFFCPREHNSWKCNELGG
ncbi:hypothetical protein AVEN_37067-1 [Araneus ventricosus]|uniref:PiggyBac transposable element-derived protein domain-containing protein n=1 Tax=Araneus ventricosus TaxID=182803 RepID=A0A4Y2NTS7_ARAVE|nr:hypothetical protein AVEN_37067-1 [Araneus ventricosus]